MRCSTLLAVPGQEVVEADDFVGLRRAIAHIDVNRENQRPCDHGASLRHDVSPSASPAQTVSRG